MKSLGFVKGTLTIKADLPTHLRQGICAEPGAQYPFIGRYANEPSFIKPDTERAPRGFAFKVFGVPGNRLSDDGLHTQDFLMNNAPQVELTDVDTTLEIIQLREKYFDSPTTLQLELAKRSDRMKQFAPGLLANHYLIGDEFFTQCELQIPYHQCWSSLMNTASFSFGPYAAHISLSPISSDQQEYHNKLIPSDAGPTFHRDSLQEYYKTHSAKYTLRAQFASDLSKHAVEDASTEWDVKTAPWHDLATLDIPAQETYSDARRLWWEEKIALSPWSGLEAHRPLGSINRLRNRVYAMGRAHRAERNAQEVKFPAEADEMPV